MEESKIERYLKKKIELLNGKAYKQFKNIVYMRKCFWKVGRVISWTYLGNVLYKALKSILSNLKIDRSYYTIPSHKINSRGVLTPSRYIWARY